MPTISNIDAYAFSRMSHRERMMNQLRGGGLGSFGLEQVLAGGRVHVLSGTSHLGMLGAASHSEITPTTEAGTSYFRNGVPQAGTPFDASGSLTRGATGPTSSDVHSAGDALPPAPPMNFSPGGVTDPSDPCYGVLCPPGQQCAVGPGGTICVPTINKTRTFQPFTPPSLTAMAPAGPASLAPVTSHPGISIMPRRVVREPASPGLVEYHGGGRGVQDTSGGAGGGGGSQPGSSGGSGSVPGGCDPGYILNPNGVCVFDDGSGGGGGGSGGGGGLPPDGYSNQPDNPADYANTGSGGDSSAYPTGTPYNPSDSPVPPAAQAAAIQAGQAAGQAAASMPKWLIVAGVAAAAFAAYKFGGRSR